MTIKRSDHGSRHIAPNPLTRPALWAVPTTVVTIVMALLASMYLGGSLNSSDSLSEFPLAVVNLDAGATGPDGSQINAGKTIGDGLTDGFDHSKFALQNLSLQDARDQMSQGLLYGAIVLPQTLSSDVIAWGKGAITAEAVSQPSVEILTNPRAGSAATSIATKTSQAAMDSANERVGKQLAALVGQELKASGSSARIPGTASAALSHPLNIRVTAFNPLPGGTGGGLSPFYYALLLVLAGFTGSIVANTFIDARLGFLPNEFGPIYRLKKNSGASRRNTLLTKWAVMALVSLIVSTIYIAVSAGFGMPIDHPWLLWAFGAATIFAVSTVVQTIQALLGNLGMLLNLFVFIIFALPSAGGTFPLEAVPPFFRWLGTFEPMHQIYLGTRSILYLDAIWTSGLGRALTAAGIASVMGILIGLLGTSFYDRKGFHRRTP